MLWIQTEKIYIDENNEDIVKIHEKKMIEQYKTLIYYS